MGDGEQVAKGKFSSVLLAAPVHTHTWRRPCCSFPKLKRKKKWPRGLISEYITTDNEKNIHQGDNCAHIFIIGYWRLSIYRLNQGVCPCQNRGNAQYMSRYVTHETRQPSDRRICSAERCNSAHVCSRSCVTTKINYCPRRMLWHGLRMGRALWEEMLTDEGCQSVGKVTVFLPL